MKIAFPSEKVIEDFVCQTIDEDQMCPVSKSRVSGYVRQHPIVGYGISDVIKFEIEDGEIILTVLELKNSNLCESHICQLSRYMTGLKRQVRRYERRLKTSIYVYGELAGPIASNPGDWVFMADLLRDDISIYDLCIDVGSGFRSTKMDHNWFSKSEDLSGGKRLARECYDAYSIQQGVIEFMRQEREAAGLSNG